ncbi:MAG TPA: iron chelate uptake ABC transporter family permease subunit, partial [Methylomirabilota bacterium]|nr:iron chelate uptake ABC transporter family permease subunit [Methylomirabilota bacterium]
MSQPAPASGARLAVLLGGLGLLVIAAALGALFVGSARVPPGDVLNVLTGRIKGVDQVVVLSLRLPRILAALLAGGALAVAGAGFQALARNPLAE